MKHLKKFNESSITHDFVEEIKYESEEHLAYLLDKDFKLWTHLKNSDKSDSFMLLELYKEISNVELEFKWLDIADSYLQFLEILSDKISIFQISFTYSNSKSDLYTEYITYDEIMSEGIKDVKLFNIMLKLKKK